MYQDRLVNENDREWFQACLGEKIKANFGMAIEDVVARQPFLYCDFIGEERADDRQYAFVDDHAKVS